MSKKKHEEDRFERYRHFFPSDQRRILGEFEDWCIHHVRGRKLEQLSFKELADLAFMKEKMIETFRTGLFYAQVALNEFRKEIDAERGQLVDQINELQGCTLILQTELESLYEERSLRKERNFRIH